MDMEIPCIGFMNLQLRYKEDFITAKLYVVDVNGPAIVGLPTCEKLKLVTIHCNTINTVDITTIQGQHSLIHLAISENRYRYGQSLMQNHL